MKESFTIEPSSGHIDFFNPINADDHQTFKGNIRLVTAKVLKIKSVTVKFIGESIVFHQQHEISTPILPKLKSKVQYKSAVLGIGQHFLPWEIDIPNIYPTSFSNKRGMVRYKIQIKISVGINKSISGDCTISLKRHMLPSQELAALVGIKVFENTVANGFRYRIEVPRIVCIEQGYLPISIKYEHLDTSRKQLVEYIFTHITQIEVYRSRSVSKTEADMANARNQSLYDLFKLGDPGLTRLQRPYRPVTINEIDRNNEDYSTVPLLLKQDLDKSLSYNLESPLVAICHQVDVVFHFGQHADDIRVKIPVLVSSVPDSDVQQRPIQKYTLETVLHKLPFAVDKSDSITKPTRTLKKSLSNVELKKKQEEKHKSIASSPPSNNRRSQYTDDSLNSPTFSTFSSSDYLSSSPPQFALTGLHPPPRRTKKKEPTSPKMKPLPNPMLPLPPIPKHIDKEKLLDISTYTDRYVSAKLPPIPRQPLIVPQNDHRLTRMYYDDDDDSDED